MNSQADDTPPEFQGGLPKGNPDDTEEENGKPVRPIKPVSRNQQ